MTLKIRVHDVGHGQAVHAFTPNGDVVVIDLGCSASFSPLEWLSKQTKTIDSLIVTHPHGDHIDEFLLLKKLGFTIRQFWRPKWLSEKSVRAQSQSSYTEKLDAYFEMSRQYNTSIDESRIVGNPNATGGVSIKKFTSKECGESNINNHSGVVVFEYHGVSVMIPGDNEPPSWKELMKQPDFVQAMNKVNVFMASHHGRESGYHADIFKEKPNLCIVSDGKVKDTCARERYTYHAKGWDVASRSGAPKENRYCVTTRSDGFVEIKIGKNANGRSYLAVTAD